MFVSRTETRLQQCTPLAPGLPPAVRILVTVICCPIMHILSLHFLPCRTVCATLLDATDFDDERPSAASCRHVSTQPQRLRSPTPTSSSSYSSILPHSHNWTSYSLERFPLNTSDNTHRRRIYGQRPLQMPLWLAKTSRSPRLASFGAFYTPAFALSSTLSRDFIGLRDS